MNNQDEVIEVVAAVRRDGDRYWVCRRTSDGSHGGLAGMWEHPGGKVEIGETKECALIRELREEFNVEAVIGKNLGTVTAMRWGNVYCVTFFEVRFDDEPELRVHDMVLWCTIDELLIQHHLPSGTVFNSRLHDSLFTNKASPLHLLPKGPLAIVAWAMQDGAIKYGVGEWRQMTTSWINHYKAAKRHMKRWVGGKSIDADSKVNALGHAIARLLIILEHEIYDLGLDDRHTYIDRSHD